MCPLKKKKKIYRCWIVWGHNIRVVILPIFLVFAFLGSVLILSYLFFIFHQANFTNYFVSFSYLGSKYNPSIHCTITDCIRPTMVSHATSVQSRHIYDCQYPGDRLDRIQDFQGVPGSQGSNLRGRNFGLDYRLHCGRKQISVYHIHTNRIWRGFVLHSTGSAHR